MSAIAPLVSLRNRLRQAVSRCSGFFDPVFSKTPGTRTVTVFWNDYRNYIYV